MDKYYISTAIAYVNGAPHIGHALEMIQADVWARYYRHKGFDTYFLTGTDEHGVKIYETAQESGMGVKDFVDENAKKFEDLTKTLGLSNDGFVRTSDDGHKRAAQKIWQKLVENGDIYKDSYEGKYCSGCEVYMTERDLDDDGNCLIHKRAPKLLKEKNYFFKLSKYSTQVKEAIASDRVQILPESRKKEMLNLIGDELHDVSFSRPKSQLPWGVDVPGDEDQVMYVWCDALSNYISAIGYEENTVDFQKYWPCDAHVIGKDILRFHAGIWLGMLIATGLELPNKIVVHGFVTGEGQKMSKSLGNVVDPLEYIDKYGVDALRYYLMREIPTLDDGDFSADRFANIYNSELANGIGNLTNRVVMMVDRYLEGIVPETCEKDDFAESLDEYLSVYSTAIESHDIKKACEVLMEVVAYANKYIDDKKPWTLAKDVALKDDVAEVLYKTVEALKLVSIMLLPIIPNTASKIAKQIGINVADLNMDYRWGTFADNSYVTKENVLFERIELKA